MMSRYSPFGLLCTLPILYGSVGFCWLMMFTVNTFDKMAEATPAIIGLPSCWLPQPVVVAPTASQPPIAL